MQTVETSATMDQELLRMLDRGIDDIHAGRTLPHDAAMREIRRIRQERREERAQARDAV